FTARTLPILQKLQTGNQTVVHENLARNAALSPAEQRVLRLLKIGTIVSAPLRLPDGWNGLILVTYPTARAIHAREISRLENIATQTATIVQNRDLLESTEQSLEESRLLY